MRRALLVRSASIVAFALTGAASCHSSSSGTAPAGSVPVDPTSPWPKFRGDAAQDGVSAVKPSTTGGAMWAYATGKGVFSSPVVGPDGTVYVGSADQSFYALGADGTLKWKIPCGEIIDSAALLDDEGRVYFGSGDSKLRAVDAQTGNVVWTMQADDPSVNSAYINWFEGNVGIGVDGTLYAGNDNFFLYAIDRDTGATKWHLRMPDQTWSLAAVDTRSGNIFVGNNNMVALLGDNTYAVTADGQVTWSMVSNGTVAASPMLLPNGDVIVGSFDGYLRDYAQADGTVKWSFPTRDHIYASTSRLPDGTIVLASADGSIYGVDPVAGTERWQFDTPESVRASPSVDGDGNIYFGGGDGKLYVLGSNGKLRWSLQLISDIRDDLTASPALAKDAIILAGASGQVFSVPYEYCVRPGTSDARCSTSAPTFADGAELTWTTDFGAKLTTPPTSIDPNQPITLSLELRQNGAAQLAILDTANVAVTVTPANTVQTVVSGDAKFLTITPPAGGFVPDANGNVTIAVNAPYLVDMQRSGLKLSGGTTGGTATSTLTLAVTPAATATVDPMSTWEITRLAVPLPTVMPSYNEIGFDQLIYLMGLAETSATGGVAWMVGGKLDGQGNAVVDPTSQAVFPLAFSLTGATGTFTAQDGLSVNVMNITLPFESFRMSARFDGQGQNATAPAALTGSTQCSNVPLYGTFLENLGLCNPTSDTISFVAGANMSWYGAQAAPSGLGTVAFTSDSSGVTATLTGSTLVAADHLASVLLVDATTGLPVTLGYALGTVRSAASDGSLASVKIPYGSDMHPASVRAYLMIDTYPAATQTLTLP